MTSRTSPEAQLRAENAELRARLAEAEDTLRAIRSNEVDALVIDTANGPQIFSLQGLDAESNRMRGELLAQVGDSVIAVDGEERITFFNAAAQRQYGLRSDDVLGRKLPGIYTHHWPAPEAETAKCKALRDHGEWHGESVQRLHDGREVHVESSITILRRTDGADAGTLIVTRDISARKQQEDTLRESQQFARSVLENLPAFVGVMTVDGTLTDANRASMEAAGIPASEVIGKKFWDCYWWSYSPEIQAQLRDACKRAAGGERVRYDVPVRMAGDTRTWIDFQISPLRDTKGRITHLIPSAMDLALRHEAEGKLRESEERFRVALSAVSDIIWTYNAAGEMDGEQPLWSAFTGQRPEDFRGFGWSKAVHPEDAQPTIEAWNLAVAEKRMFEFEHRVRRHDGEWRLCTVRAKPVRYPSGEIREWVGVHTDITASRHSATELQRVNSLLDTLLHTAPIGFCFLDRDLRFVRINERLAQMNGVPVEAHLGRHASEIVPALFESLRDLTGRILTTGEAELNHEFSGETPATPGVTRFWNESWYPVRDGAGEVVGFGAVVEEITERKRAESDLRVAKARAEKANRAKTDFLSSMSHELRTPLNSILGFAQLLESGASPPTPSQKRSIDQILRAGWHLLDLITEILDLAVIESGNVMLSLDPVSLTDVMLDCRAMIEPQAQQRGIGIQFPRFETLHFVKADRTRLKQVLVNLVFNAIKYNKPEGTVAVEVTLKSPGLVRICVRDTGAGLAPAQQAQLFQPFNRLGQERGAEEGTGIGLVVTKRLVELMGGTVGVDSTVGVGSTFWIELSQTAAPQFAAADLAYIAQVQPQPPDGVPQHTLLYIEDNSANQALIEQLIARRPDMRLLCAADGEAGIAFARDYQPALILMDITLPGISGVEVLQILQKDPSTAHIPIVALSANAMPSDIAKGMDAGFLNYITKPIKVDQFMDALDQALKFAQTSSRRAVPQKASI